MPFTLVLGAARSGKSRFAEQAVLKAHEETARGPSPPPRAHQRPLYIATAVAGDAEMAARIARHRADRGDVFITRETPLAIPAAVAPLMAGDVALVDCLTLWLSNAMAEGQDYDARIAGLIRAVEQCPARLWLVSNEVGWGVVPDNALARRFRDDAGRLHQSLAAKAEAVALIVAGLPLWLKS
jgi:adenosylcobinamide kinase/adenosylcobinamide-phosphate guanylyltransferase